MLRPAKWVLCCMHLWCPHGLQYPGPVVWCCPLRAGLGQFWIGAPKLGENRENLIVCFLTQRRTCAQRTPLCTPVALWPVVPTWPQNSSGSLTCEDRLAKMKCGQKRKALLSQEKYRIFPRQLWIAGSPRYGQLFQNDFFCWKDAMFEVTIYKFFGRHFLAPFFL